jgi:hypothetical protein
MDGHSASDHTTLCVVVPAKDPLSLALQVEIPDYRCTTVPTVSSWIEGVFEIGQKCSLSFRGRRDISSFLPPRYHSCDQPLLQ